MRSNAVLQLGASSSWDITLTLMSGGRFAEVVGCIQQLRKSTVREN